MRKIYEIYKDQIENKGWVCRCLTDLASAPLCLLTAKLTVSIYSGGKRLYYRTKDNELCELFHSKFTFWTWKYLILSNNISCDPIVKNFGGQSSHIIYKDTDNQFIEMHRGNYNNWIWGTTRTNFSSTENYFQFEICNGYKNIFYLQDNNITCIKCKCENENWWSIFSRNLNIKDKKFTTVVTSDEMLHLYYFDINKEEINFLMYKN